MSKIGIYFGSTTGNTENLAGQIKKELPDAELINVSQVGDLSFDNYDLVILGTSTWGAGELQDDWQKFEGDLEKLSLKNKKVAFFGTGDQSSYPDSFCDGVGALYEAMKKSGAKCIGAMPVEKREFSSSRAVVDGKFVGLVVDDNQQKVPLKEWCSSLQKELNAA